MNDKDVFCKNRHEFQVIISTFKINGVASDIYKGIQEEVCEIEYKSSLQCIHCQHQLSTYRPYQLDYIGPDQLYIDQRFPFSVTYQGPDKCNGLS